MDTNSMGFSLLSKSMQKRILEQQGEEQAEVQPAVQQPEVVQPQNSDERWAEMERKYGKVDADRMRKYGLSERDL